MTLRNGRLTNRSRMAEKAAASVRAAPPPPVKRVRDRDEEGNRTYRAFTVRIPTPLYERLRRDAVDEERSVSAQTQVYLEELYAALDASA